jgi:hypothetical protein
MRGKASDISARRAHEARQHVTPWHLERYSMTTYAMAIPVSSDAFARPFPAGNLSNRWRPGHGKRYFWRRRKEPYWGEALK